MCSPLRRDQFGPRRISRCSADGNFSARAESFFARREGWGDLAPLRARAKLARKDFRSVAEEVRNFAERIQLQLITEFCTSLEKETL